MAGMFFDYFDGYLRVTFSNGPWPGDIEISFHVSGDTVATTPCDDAFEKGEAQIAVSEDVVLRCWTSSSMSRFFQYMVSWLEAVTCNVAECAFFWDGEGPEGELRWFGGPSNSGTLRLAWSGRHDSQAFEHKVRLEKNQMVQTLYQTFREFVESDRYDPISYETLLYGEVFDLVLIEGRESLARELAVRERPDAYALTQTIMGFAYEYKRGFPRRADLAEFIHMSKIYWGDRSIDANEVDEQIGDLLDKAWNNWTVDQRRRFVEDELFLFGGCGGFGESLRKLRSPLLEAWLKSQA
jgi:hypothetical protein